MTSTDLVTAWALDAMYSRHRRGTETELDVAARDLIDPDDEARLEAVAALHLKERHRLEVLSRRTPEQIEESLAEAHDRYIRFREGTQ